MGHHFFRIRKSDTRSKSRATDVVSTGSDETGMNDESDFRVRNRERNPLIKFFVIKNTLVTLML